MTQGAWFKFAINQTKLQNKGSKYIFSDVVDFICFASLTLNMGTTKLDFCGYTNWNLYQLEIVQIR